MLNQVQFLWPFVLIFCCASIKWDGYEDNDPKIEVPENCSISPLILNCPNFTMLMYMEKGYDSRGIEYKEYRSIVECTPNSLPYKYLRRTNSSRNSLTMYCQVPESGSFGEGWPQLEYLEIFSTGQIGPWKREHFSGLNNLKMLLFNSNHQMPDDLFADLGKLRILRLGVNRVNKNVFKDLRELEELELRFVSSESLDNFDASELKSALKLKRLTLNWNSITHLTKQFFEYFSRVEILTFRHNKIEAIDANAFEPLTSLKIVRFQFNEWNSLPSGLFSKNDNLEEVTFDDRCKFTTLPSGFLSNLPNLRKISFFCKLTTIPSDLISGSTNLETLDLRFNRLTSLPRDLLYNHTKLKEIKLDGNRISELANDHFYNKSNLTEIYCIHKNWVHSGWIPNYLPANRKAP